MLLRKLSRKYRIALIAVAVASSSLFSLSFVDDYFEVSKNLDIFTTMFREVNLYYVDPVDPGKLMKKGIENMLADLDPYTNYIPESDIEDYRFMTTGHYGGIGAVIRQKGEYAVISDPYQGYPAQKSGLLAGDVILEIDGKNAKGKRTDEVSQALKGSPGTQVKLLVKREGATEPLTKVLTREEIKVNSVSYSGVVRDSIGYIRLNNFTENAGKAVATAFRELKAQNIRGLVLDLRGNPGGLLNEAVNISNIFIDRGKEIVSTKGKIKELDRTYKAINEPIDKSMPLVVLVNSGSASASEIVSGSLQDFDRAVIIGQRTFGKGLVQTTRPLSYNAQLKITTAKYYIPSGRCIQALDYSARNEDGSVGKIPDSLVTPFKTQAGRTVYNGGGVLPDLVMQPRKYSNIAASLVSKSIIFDYATSYFIRHPQPKTQEIKFTEADFDDFQTYIADKDYDYVTKSEKTLEDLRKNSEEEKYYADLKNDIDALKSKLAHNKQEDVFTNKEEIISLIEEELASRYFYQAGRIKQALTHDRELDRAIEVLNDNAYYTGLLSGAVKADAGTAVEGK